MKIGLMGCEFESANKGCEALSYSIIYVLKKCLEDSKQILTIYNFSGTELGRIPTEFNNIKFINVKPRLKDITFNYLRKINECDLILDATMGDSFSDIYSEKYYKRLIRDKKIAQFFCKNYILLPQTYGPFQNKKSENMAKKVCLNAKKIYCRDEMSKKMLEQSFKIKNAELVTDMAFLLPYYKERFLIESSKIKIGLNVSGLLYKGGFNRENQFDLKMNYKEFINNLIEIINKNNKYEIHLIPHVIDLAENAYDDDYKICKSLKERYPECILAPDFNNPIDAKSYISNMDIFIGSRMHSTIAAFSSNVITIPVSYSRKFEGLFNSLEYEYVINGKSNTTNEAIDKIFEFIDKKNELMKAQKDAQQIINSKRDRFIMSLNDEIQKIFKGE